MWESKYQIGGKARQVHQVSEKKATKLTAWFTYEEMVFQAALGHVLHQ